MNYNLARIDKSITIYLLNDRVILLFSLCRSYLNYLLVARLIETVVKKKTVHILINMLLCLFIKILIYLSINFNISIKKYIACDKFR